jgi:hypothetical protein
MNLYNPFDNRQPQPSASAIARFGRHGKSVKNVGDILRIIPMPSSETRISVLSLQPSADTITMPPACHT